MKMLAKRYTFSHNYDILTANQINGQAYLSSLFIVSLLC